MEFSSGHSRHCDLGHAYPKWTTGIDRCSNLSSVLYTVSFWLLLCPRMSDLTHNQNLDCARRCPPKKKATQRTIGLSIQYVSDIGMVMVFIMVDMSLALCSQLRGGSLCASAVTSSLWFVWRLDTECIWHWKLLNGMQCAGKSEPGNIPYIPHSKTSNPPGFRHEYHLCGADASPSDGQHRFGQALLEPFVRCRVDACISPPGTLETRCSGVEALNGGTCRLTSLHCAEAL
eukprot:4698875-Amphidinium_carterae.1